MIELQSNVPVLLSIFVRWLRKSKHNKKPVVYMCASELAKFRNLHVCQAQAIFSFIVRAAHTGSQVSSLILYPMHKRVT